jgi:hypothetical protein
MTQTLRTRSNRVMNKLRKVDKVLFDDDILVVGDGVNEMVAAGAETLLRSRIDGNPSTCACTLENFSPASLHVNTLLHPQLPYPLLTSFVKGSLGIVRHSGLDAADYVRCNLATMHKAFLDTHTHTHYMYFDPPM